MRKRMRVDLMDVVVCLALATVLAVLAAPGTALADGKTPACVEFRDYPDDGVFSDGGGSYCDSKRLKVYAAVTPQGKLELTPNTGRGNRTLFVEVDLGEGNGPQVVVARHFYVGNLMPEFDLRAIGTGETSTNVNVYILATPPEDREGIRGWIITFGQGGPEIPLCPREGSTGADVFRHATDTWMIETFADYKAHLVERTFDGEWVHHGLVTVPPFAVTVTLAP